MRNRPPPGSGYSSLPPPLRPVRSPCCVWNPEMPIASELSINTAATAEQMFNTIFGEGVQLVANTAAYSGATMSSGIYTGALGTIAGISPTNTGVILSTGNVADFTNSSGTTNTNTAAGTGIDVTGGIDSDSQLNAVAGMNTFDGAILTASFIPDGDWLTMQFVFSSEEYPEYVNQNVNDAFGVWVNGTFVPVSISVAGNVAIDEINAARNENLYQSNTGDQFNTEMDGLTYVLSLKAPVNAGQVNTIKIGIADGGDAIYDSNLLIMGDSVQTIVLAMDDDVNVVANGNRTFDILANDSAERGDLTITQINGQNVVVGQTITLTSGQQVRLNADQTVTIFANGTLGQENFTYTVFDGTQTDVGYITINTVSAPTRDGIVSGTSGNDVINASYVGDPDGDRIDNNDGLGVQGTTGDADLIYAGAGNDTVVAGAGNDIIFGGDGDDSVLGWAGDDRVDLGDGNDSFGTWGNDSAGNDSVAGGNGNDTIIGGAGNDILRGEAGNDALSGGMGSDTLDGGDGADVFWITDDHEADVISGGEGGIDSDTIAFSNFLTTAGVRVTFTGAEGGNYAYLATPSGFAQAAGTFTGIEALTLTAHADTVDAGASTAALTVSAGDGNDTLVTGSGGSTADMGAGDDTATGGAGSDILTGGTGNDVLSGAGGVDTLTGGDGDDILSGGAGGDSLAGGTGMDYADYSASNAAVTVNLNTFSASGGHADGDSLSGIDGLFGSSFNDVLTGFDGQVTGPGAYTNIFHGNAGDDTLDGAGGNDTLFGGADSDSLIGGAGDDLLDGGTGNDRLDGGTGNDSLVGGAGADTLTGGAGNDSLSGGADRDLIIAAAGDTVDGGETGDDFDTLVVAAGSSITYGGGNGEAGTIALAGGGSLSFAGIEQINFFGAVDGTAGNDVIGVGYVDAQNDTVDGADGNDDTIFGWDGNDSIQGGAGNDTIYGGAGRDTIAGGAGNDVLEGNGNVDLILIGANEGQDVVDGGSAATDLDYLEFTGTTNGLSVTYTGTESGSWSWAGGSGTFTEIEVVTGSAGNDTINAAAATGGVGIVGGDGDDSLTGGAGADNIEGGSGTDRIDGGDGADTLSGNGGDDTLTGGLGSDWLFVGSGDDTAFGGDGDDYIADISGNDSLSGGAGDDTIIAGDGNDRITGDGGNDTLQGGAGDDRFLIADGAGTDSVTGGETAETGGDTLDASGVTQAITLDLSAGAGGAEDGTLTFTGGNVTFTEIEHVILGAGADSVIGSAGADSVTAGAGADRLDMGAGNDRINLGTDGATDTLILDDGDGQDRILGFEAPVLGSNGIWTARDLLDVSALTDAQGYPVNVADVTVSDDGSGNAVLTFPNGESLTFVGVAPAAFSDPAALVAIGIPAVGPVEGTAGDDFMSPGYTDAQGDQIDGSDGTNDTIFGGAGSDIILDGAGNDTVFGGTEDDIFFGGAGADTLSGDAGNDIFNLTGTSGFGDSIDGGAGNDRIDTTAINFGATVVLTGDGAGTLGTSQTGATFSGIEHLILGAQSDSVDASADSTGLRIESGAGADTITGGSGADFVLAGDGDDTLAGGGGDDSLYGEVGSDSIAGGAGADFIDGGADADTLRGGSGNDRIEGGDGNDLVLGEGGDDSINGGVGNDSVSGGAGNDYVRGSFGNDTVAGGEGDDYVWGGFGDDIHVVEDNFGNDTFYGDSEQETLGDTLDLSAVTTDLRIDLTDGNAERGSFSDGTWTATFDEMEHLVLGSGQDTLVLADGSGTDRVQGFAAPVQNPDGTWTAGDLLDVSDLTADGTRPVTVADVVVSDDGNGNAVLTFPLGEVLVLIGVSPAQVGNAQALHAMGIPLALDQTVQGTAGDDVIDAGYLGDPGGDRVDANDNLAGTNDDIIDAGAGHDTVFAGAGNDSVLGGSGDDILYGGAGDDVLSGGTGTNTLFGDGGNDSLTGGDDFDILVGGTGDDTIAAGGESDLIQGGSGNDTILGGTGNDLIYGEDGDDSIAGEAGNDTVFAGSGNDLIDGGSGNDVLSGEGGDDLFILTDGFGTDTVTGGETGETLGDTLDASGLSGDVTVDLSAGNPASPEDGTLTTGGDILTFAEIETIILGGGNDSVIGSSGADTVDGGAGNDTLAGGEGADSLSGGAGNDTLVIGEGDIAAGGSGDDLFILTPDMAVGPVSVTGGTGTDTLQLGSGADLSTLNITATGPNGLTGTVTLDDGSILSFSEVENIICFTPGARIATPGGARPVETLAVGDLVVTRDHGLQPIRWIGRRTLPAIGRHAPIRIRPGRIIGQERDLIVSPQHRMLIKSHLTQLFFGESEVLVAARHLVDGQTVTQEEGGLVTYIHILFDRHEVIYAEGAATESFHPGDIGLSAVTDAAREEIFDLFPELRSMPHRAGQTARRCLKRYEAALIAA